LDSCSDTKVNKFANENKVVLWEENNVLEDNFYCY